ncbi:MAG: putative lipid II flippase FtsW [Candidatus Magasanikbacteria bacterium]
MSTRTMQSDKVLLILFGVLVAFGIVMLTSAGSAIGLERFDDSYFFVKRQLLYGLLPGTFIFFLCVRVSLDFVKRNAFFIFVVCISLLLLVFIPGIGSSYNTGANSWLQIWNYSFQPSEFAKLALIIFFAAYLGKKSEELLNFQQGFLMALALAGIPIVLVALQPDIGTVAILFAIVIGMLFVAEAKILHISLLAGAGIFVFFLMTIIAPYRAERLTTFLHPELDPQGIGYQINQSFIAIGSGGIFGHGLGHSRQKYQYLPEVHADSIFAIIAEEMGFVVTIGFILLLVFITIRGLKISRTAPDMFSRLLVAGIIIWIVAQSFLNIGAIVGLLPLTGVPLPFVSHGGTALMIAMAGMGFVINVSRHT